MAFYSNGEILNSVDHRLEACYDTEQARAALVVGLLCCKQTPQCRPSIAMVISYLNEEDGIPNIDETWGVSTSSTTVPTPLSLSVGHKRDSQYTEYFYRLLNKTFYHH